MAAGVQDLTRHLNGQRGKDAWALDDHVYDELRRIVAAQLKREKGGLTGRGTDMNVTKVCHDVWLKLQSTSEWDSRRHYFGSAARAARQVLVDAANYGAGHPTVGLGEQERIVGEYLSPRDARRIRIMDEVARVAAAAGHRQGCVLELRFFGGLSTEAIADLMRVSRKTVQRDLQSIWPDLRRALGDLFPDWLDESDDL